jgi:hypothetical protein
MQNHLNYWAIRHGMVHPKVSSPYLHLYWISLIPQTRIDDVRTDRYRLAANTTAKKKGLALCFMGRTYNLAFVDS